MNKPGELKLKPRSLGLSTMVMDQSRSASLTVTSSQAGLLEWERYPDKYFKECLTIRDKLTVKNIPFILNTNQILVQAAIDKQRRAGKPVRIQILKYRQGGFSTQAAANIFHGVRFTRGAAMVVSHDLDSAEHIFGIYHRFEHFLPESETNVLRAAASNRKELKFEEPHGGRIVVETAGKTSAGHSYTLNFLHLSEVSRWPEGTEDALAGLLNSVPDAPNTMIIVESVANGMSGWFYDEWRKQDSAYVKIFVPWFDQVEYVMELPIPADRYTANLTDVEKRLVADYRLTLEQVEWRRHTITNKLQGNTDKFKEQYPATAQEAFIASGNPFFNTEVLEAVRTADPLRCELVPDEQALRLQTNPRGRLRVWKRPQPNVQYVIGCDVAEGIEVDGAPADDRRDYSSADVLDRATGEQVAQLHGHITPDEFGRQLARLGKFYNNAFIGVESNAGYGYHVLSELEREQYPQHLLYRQQVLDEVSRRSTHKMGWRTTVANRRSMMAALDMALRQAEVFINSAETVRELLSFITKPNGRIEGGNGQKDDRVFSLAIAYQMLNAAPAMVLDSRGNDTGMNAVLRYRPSASLLNRPAPQPFAHPSFLRARSRFRNDVVN